MALISPGLQLSVTDESQYVPGAVGSTPLVILATAQDKTANGSYATGTSKSNAGKLQVFTSQRELVSALGYPSFKQSAAGTPMHGSPLNEYGLMAAYSTLAGANRVYAIRADIDLNELEATSNRPIGAAEDGTFWLDLGETTWGINEWDASRKLFVEKEPILILDASDTVYQYNRNEPKPSIGQIGDYAVVLTEYPYRVYHKDDSNLWRPLGSSTWQYRAWPAVVGTTPNQTLVVGNDKLIINGQGIDFPGSGQLSDLVASINAEFLGEANGIRAEIIAGKLAIFVTADSSFTDDDGNEVTGAAKIEGTGLAEIGLSAGVYAAPTVYHGSYINTPQWATSDLRPSGSVYIKTSAIGGGMNLSLKRYVAESDSWTNLAVPVFGSDASAVYNMDPINGGYGIDLGSCFAKYDPLAETGAVGVSFEIYYKFKSGKVEVSRAPTGLGSNPATIRVLSSVAGSESLLETLINVPVGTTVADYSAKFVTALAAANIPDVYARVESNGDITIVHAAGGVIYIADVVGSALGSAGFTFANSRDDGENIILFNFTRAEEAGYNYEISFTPPYTNPAEGTLWYYGDLTEVDIMVNTGASWKGYKNVAQDARGYDLRNTDPLGVIVSPSKPKFQNNGTTPLATGDLWLDSSDLENYPKLYRYNVSGKWVAIDNTDRISQNGIVFADARWSANGDDDVVAGDKPAITELLTSDYLDPDAPNPRLYPPGTLLFNTRRSGFNVKKYVSDYFSEDNFPDNDDLPMEKATWVSVSGLKDSGAPYMGAQAQRNMVVKAMRSALDGNTQVREDQFFFNLIAAPGFPEMITNMVALNNDRKNTAFVIGDTPMTLPADSIAVANWANNVNGDGLSTADPYLGIFYPAGLTNDVSGNTVVVPASHMMLRTFIRNDNVSYPWFAPAGTRRGLIDNATDIGYINPVTGGFVRNGINQGMRDALYENRVNPLTILPGVGLVAWGQKTRNPSASAMDRVNVARLVNYIRTILASVGNGFLFEPNDKITRDQIKSIIEGAMNDLVAKRGIYDYLVVCDSTNNTPDRIARNELYVDIAIEPMKAVEFIYIPIRLKNPGDIAKLGG